MVFVPFKRKIQVIKNVQEIPIKFQFVMILLNLHKEIIILERGIKYIIHQDTIKVDFILIQ